MYITGLSNNQKREVKVFLKPNDSVSMYEHRRSYIESESTHDLVIKNRKTHTAISSNL